MARWITWGLVAAAFIGIVAVGLFQVRRHLPTPSELAPLVQRELSHALQAPVHIGQVEMGWGGVTVREVQVLPDRRSPTGHLLVVPTLRLRWSWRLLLTPTRWRQAVQRELAEVFRQVLVHGAILFLWRDRTGRWNADPFLAPPSARRRQLPVVTFRRSELVLGDEALPLPDGTPFRLHLTDADGRWRQGATGFTLHLRGKVAPPLAVGGGMAELTLVERVGERGRTVEGRLRFARVRAERLPERMRRWLGGRLVVWRGELTDGAVRWRRNGGRWQLRFALSGRQLRAAWRQNGQVFPLLLREAAIHGAVAMEGRHVGSWQATVRWHSQPLWGEGQIVVEGNPTGWHLRWQGGGLRLSLLAPAASLFGLDALPLTSGALHGRVAAEGWEKGWRVETNLVGEKLRWRAETLQRVRQRARKGWGRWVSLLTGLAAADQAQLTGWAEGSGRVGEGKGQGALVIRAVWRRPVKGGLSGTVRWRGGQGRAEGEVLRFPLGWATFSLPFQGKELKGCWSGGIVSGEGALQWQHHRLRVERARLQLTDGVVQGDGLPPTRVAFSLRADGDHLVVPQMRLRWQGGAVVTGTGDIFARSPIIWKVEGALNSSAVTSLSGWLRQKWALPLQLFVSGPLRAQGRGVGKQWVAEGRWVAPQGTAQWWQKRWGFRAERLSALLAPQGAAVWGPRAQLTLPPDAAFESFALRLSNWQLRWDAKGRQVAAVGEVFLPSAVVFQVPLRDVRAQVEVTFRTDGQGWRLRAQNLSGSALQGAFTDGWLQAQGEAGGRWQVAGAGQAKDISLSEMQRLCLPLPLTLRGKFSGRWQGKGSPAEVQVALVGDIDDPSAATEKVCLSARHIRGLSGAVVLAHRQGRWQVQKVMGEAAVKGAQMIAEGEEWRVEGVTVQGIAERISGGDGWCWDVRVPQGQWVGGQISGQVAMDGQRLHGQVGFIGLDGEHLTALARRHLPPPHRPPPLKGRIGGWLRFQFARQGTTAEGEWWQGGWEGALSLEDGAVGGWSVKLGGVRAQGQVAAGVQQGRLVRWRTQGEVEGIHVLSPHGQAVLDGSFSLEGGEERRRASVALQGHWGMVSLRRLSEGLSLPKPLQGIAEGTLKVRWDDGALRAEGTVKVPAIMVGEGVRLTGVEGEWAWQPHTLRVQRLRAQGDGGALTAEGAWGTAKPFPLTLRVQGEGLSASTLRAMVREWHLPVGDLEWRGRFGGTVLIYWDEKRRQVTVQLESPEVTVSDALLGAVRLDVRLQQQLPNGEWQWQGRATAHQGGMTAQVEGEGAPSQWRLAWRVGQLPLTTLRALLQAIPPLREEWQDELHLPLTGNLWTEGEGQFQGRQVKALRATVSAPQVWGVGEESLSLHFALRHDGQRWLAQPLELRQRSARIAGWVAVGEKERLEGELSLAGVRRTTVVGVLRLLGVRQVPSLPDGVLQGQLRLSGTVSRPEGEGSLRVNEVRWAGWRLPQLVVRRFTVDGKRLWVAEGEGEIRFDGEASPARFWGAWAFRDGRALQGHLSLPRVPLAALVPPETGIQISGGWVQGEWDLRGTIDQPYLVGWLEGEAQAIRFLLPHGGRQTVRQVRWRLAAEGTTVRLEEASAQWDGGTIAASGTLNLRKGGWQNPFANEGVITLNARNLQTTWNGTTALLREATLRLTLGERALTVRVDQVSGNGWEAEGKVRWGADLWENARKDPWQWLARGDWDVTLRLTRFRWQVEGASGQLTGRLRLQTLPDGDVPLLSGNLTVAEGTIARLAVGGGEAKPWGLPAAVRFAVGVRVGDGLFLRNPQATVLLRGSAQLSGTLAQPRLEGEIQGRTGTVRLPASVLTLTEMTLPFAASVDPLNKRWQWTARLRVEGEAQLDIHRIIVIVSGPIDERSQRLGILPTVTMLATPPLPERTVLERLFGVSLAQLSQALTDWQQLFSGALVQSFMGELLAPLATPIAEALRLSELSLLQEQTTGQRWLRLGFPLSPRLHLLWRQGLSSSDPSAVEVQYFLGKRASVTWIKRERERAEIRIQTSVRF